MIICHVRHGRTRRDATCLARHLMKAEPSGPAILHAITGLAATSLPAALHAMRRLAPTGAAAFHHVSLSPAGDWTADALTAAAACVVRELGADPASHPHAIVLHHKRGPPGRGALHAHVVIAHWNGSGPGLRDGWCRLRLERLARELEFEAGETPTRGRHDRAIARALRLRGHDAIADALDAAQTGQEPPRSPVTSSARQALQRQGIDDAAARRAVVAAWAACDTPASLRHALTEAGLRLTRGDKLGVWVVTTDTGVVIGALDRIVRRRRAEITTFMERDHADRIAPVRGTDPTRSEDRPQDRAPVAVARPAGRARGTKPDRGHPGMPDRDAGRAKDHAGDPAPHRARDPSKARRRVRDRAAATALAAISIPDIRQEAERRFLQRKLDELRVIYDAAQAKLSLASEPLPTPDSLIQARRRTERAGQANRAAREAMHAAAARLDAVNAAQPKGFRAVMAWITGETRRYRREAVQAALTSRRARDRHEVAEGLAVAFQAALEAETGRLAAARVRDAAIRRERAEVARHEVAVAIEAARLLRNHPTLAALTTCDLIRQAQYEIRRLSLESSQRPGLTPFHRSR